MIYVILRDKSEYEFPNWEELRKTVTDLEDIVILLDGRDQLAKEIIHKQILD